MFSSKSQLQKRTPENGTDRRDYLSLLVDEYLNSTSPDAKLQVLANLANFSYDPINFSFIREVGVLDIFLFIVKNESCEKLLHFATAGICNLCVDPLNTEYLVTNEGLNSLLGLLKSEDSEIFADIITTLFYLHINKPDLNIGSDTKELIQELTKSENKQIQNLASIFLQEVRSVNKKH